MSDMRDLKPKLEGNVNSESKRVKKKRRGRSCGYTVMATCLWTSSFVSKKFSCFEGWMVREAG
jgi:hypothetical protein